MSFNADDETKDIYLTLYSAAIGDAPAGAEPFQMYLNEDGTASLYLHSGRRFTITLTEEEENFTDVKVYIAERGEVRDVTDEAQLAEQDAALDLKWAELTAMLCRKMR